jgi:hypothetical protein
MRRACRRQLEKGFASWSPRNVPRVVTSCRGTVRQRRFPAGAYRHTTRSHAGKRGERRVGRASASIAASEPASCPTMTRLRVVGTVSVEDVDRIGDAPRTCNRWTRLSQLATAAAGVAGVPADAKRFSPTLGRAAVREGAAVRPRLRPLRQLRLPRQRWQRSRRAGLEPFRRRHLALAHPLTNAVVLFDESGPARGVTWVRRHRAESAGHDETDGQGSHAYIPVTEHHHVTGRRVATAIF